MFTFIGLAVIVSNPASSGTGSVTAGPGRT